MLLNFDFKNPSLSGRNLNNVFVFIQDAVHDGLRAVKNALEDGCVIPGAGAYEVAVHIALKKAMEELKGRERLGMQAYADGMLIIPKVLAVNAGTFSCYAS